MATPQQVVAALLNACKAYDEAIYLFAQAHPDARKHALICIDEADRLYEEAEAEAVDLLFENEVYTTSIRENVPGLGNGSGLSGDLDLEAQQWMIAAEKPELLPVVIALQKLASITVTARAARRCSKAKANQQGA